MPFTESDKQKMLAIKWVGASVIARLEQLGFSELAQLKNETPENLARQVSEMLGSSCWRNSPQARAALQGIIDLASR